MKPAERNIIDEDSDFFIYTPSMMARHALLYPLRVGHFHYQAGYRQSRRSFDSFLVMTIIRGTATITVSSGTFTARSGQFVLIDCYAPHAYSFPTDSEVLWLHFDGVNARGYFDLITQRSPIITLRDATYATTRLNRLYHIFEQSQSITEPTLAKLITDVLTACAIAASTVSSDGRDDAPQSAVFEDVLAYITAHLSEPLSIQELAAQAFMSEYHFIRAFKKNVGYTPHVYIMDARVNAAKYMLANSDASLQRICADCGFSAPSALCAAFKRSTGVTPMQFRQQSKHGEDND